MTTVARTFFASPHIRASVVTRRCVPFLFDGRSQKEVAEEYGFAYGSLRQWVRELRQHCRHDGAESPFFKT